MTDLELARELDILRGRLPLIERATIEALPQVTRKAEAAVYRDDVRGVVYKISDSVGGRLGTGNGPGALAVMPGGGVFAKGEPVTVASFLRRHAINNAQGGLVYTELAGVTTDGAVVVRQRFVRDAEHTFEQDPLPMLREAGLVPLNDYGTEAVARVGGRLAIFGDLHEENILRDADGRVFIVDTPSRFLSDEEAALVEEALAERGEALPPLDDGYPGVR